MPARPQPLTEAERDAARSHPGLTRALQLIALGLRSEGVREWNFSLRGMNDRALLAAAERACEREVWDRCINTSDRTRHEIDLDQRFPMPFREDVVASARDIGVDPAYVYGLIRQESRFVMDARSHVGASGLMQLMPSTARWTARKIGLPYSAGQTMNNWMLSSARAEATRKALAASGIGNDRFARIEGVADREPFAKGDVYDPRNRRMSIILGWSAGASDGDADSQLDAETKAAIKERDNPKTLARTEAQKLDMGGTSLPAGAQLINPTAPGTSNKPGKH